MTNKREHEQPQYVWVRRSLVLQQTEARRGCTNNNRSSTGGRVHVLLNRSQSFDDNNPKNATITAATTHVSRSNSSDAMNPPSATRTAPLQGSRHVGDAMKDRFQMPTPAGLLKQSTATTTNSSSSGGSIATDDRSLSSATSLTLPWQSTPYEWMPGVLLSGAGHKEANLDNSNSDDTVQDDGQKNNDRSLQIRILFDSQQSRTDSCLLSDNDQDTCITVPSSKFHTDVHYANSVPSQTRNQPAAPDDLTQLEHFHEPALVACLRQRFAQRIVYTKTGPILIAVNPFVHLENMYSEATMQQYCRSHGQAETEVSSSSEPLPPHVYGMADDAFRSMMRAMEMNLSSTCGSSSSRKTNARKRRLNQSILVSGESGSGKTVTVKYIMKYLAALSQQVSRAAASRRIHLPSNITATSVAPAEGASLTSSSDNVQNAACKSCGSVENQVLQSNPILESFGNARTVRNDNSSRFGKFMEMQFTATGRLIGTRIQTYLLEKVRVVHINPGERNYHIFYELLTANGGLSHEQQERLHLLKANGVCHEPSEFALLSASGTFARRDGVQDVATFRELKTAMSTIGFDEEDRMQVFAMAAAILHASNLRFEAASDDDKADACRLKADSVHLNAVCDLLGVSTEALNEALCYRCIKAAGKSIRSPLDQNKARKGLEALLKSTYGALFKCLVQRVDASIAGTAEPSAVIGVLDIFGFESFAVNSFEQLCINYCNEVLQQQFNTFMLKNEQAEYASEGIDWDFIKFPDNQDVLDLLDDRANGIMSILDDMCKAPGATDKSFAIEIVKRCETLPRFEACYKKSAPLFSIQHYAGIVEYSTECFVEKNRDDLPRETSMLLMGSSNLFVHKLAEIISYDHNDTSASALGNTAMSASRATVGGQFRQQVKELRAKIESTCPHYVRCIKPNAMLVPDRFDCAMVLDQLRCGGVLQAVSVTRDGFTLHYTHAEFLNRYEGLMRGSHGFVPLPPSNGKANVLKQTRALVDDLLERISSMQASKEDNDSRSRTEGGNSNVALIHVGKSKILLKHHAFEALEAMLGALKNKHATVLNAIMRRYLCRMAFISARDHFREELRREGKTFDEWFKEHRELYYQPRSKRTISGHFPNIVKTRMEMFKKASSASFQKS